MTKSTAQAAPGPGDAHSGADGGWTAAQRATWTTFQRSFGSVRLRCEESTNQEGEG